MNALVIWHGTYAEATDLLQAIERNCGCETHNGTLVRCGAHDMLDRDQRAIDGLLFARRIASRLLDEEFGPDRPAADEAAPTPVAAPAKPPARPRRKRRSKTAPGPS